MALVDDELKCGSYQVPQVRTDVDQVEADDVVVVDPRRPELQVLYRCTDAHHTVFLTNRCNSRCVMCSQPPSPNDDSWLIEEAKSIAIHISQPPECIGFTGGEPLLLGPQLREVLDVFFSSLERTTFDVLTNGRLLSDPVLATHLLEGLPARVWWMVPLYGHADFLHDEVVCSAGAFDQTMSGLLTLCSYSQPIQLRIVLINPVLEILPDLCAFIGRSLPFVNEVALMGCEPAGFALANRDACAVDIGRWGTVLSHAVKILRRAHIRPVLMNLPLCTIPHDLWQFAHRSISEWKQVYVPECEGCDVRESCCGMFAWHRRGWRPATISPIHEGAFAHE